MKTVIHILFMVIVTSIFTACDTTIPVERGKATFDGRPIDVVTFDGCEYVYMRGGESRTLTHKGNCKFCAQRESITNSNQKSK